MSLAELMPYESEPRRAGDRTPPQDNPAEQCVLGAMLMSKDAIADVVETVRGGDFYRPAHEFIFDSILDLYGRGEPADAITVAAELTKRGEISRVGGHNYLHDLLASVPVAANAGYYAEIVREKAILRRLVEASLKIAQMGYGAQGDVNDIVDQAQAAVYAVTDRRASEDYKPLSELMETTLDEIEAIGSRGGQMAGVPTGFAELDELTNGLHAGQMIIVAARPAMGKALALETPLPTPTGWTTMGDVVVGDELMDADGFPTRVIAATTVLHNRPCYRITFSDGSTVVADARHEWRATPRLAAERQVNTATRSAELALADGVTVPSEWVGGFPGEMSVEFVQTSSQSPLLATSVGRGTTSVQLVETSSPPRLVTTEQMAQTTWLTDGVVNWSVGVSAALQLRKTRLPLAPYALGVALAGGVSIDDAIALDHIPAGYLRASEAQRRDLLAGMLDTGGRVLPTGVVQFSAMKERLVSDTFELVVSLGYQCSVSVAPAADAETASRPGFTVQFQPGDEVFRMEQRRGGHAAVRCVADTTSQQRYITDITPVMSIPVRCVEVDNDDHLYLATRAMIPTHNSTLGLDLARAASIKHGLCSAIFSLEMSQVEITMRLLSAEAQIPLNHIRKGTMTDEDWTRLAKKMGEVSEAPLFIDDSPNLTMMEIRAKARRLRQRHDLKLVIIDYMQLMTSGKKVESRQLEVSEFSRQLKLLAKELEIPVVAISQLNRGPEQRNDKKPMLSDLRESGCLTADTRMLRADTGEEVAMGDLLAAGATNIPVWSLDDDRRLVARTMTHVFPSGMKEVFRLTLASGRQIKATANHPFLTFDGWMPLGELVPGSRIAAPRRLPVPLHTAAWDDEEIILQARRSCHETFIPSGVFGLPTEQVRAFIRHLWATDGSVRWDAKVKAGRIYYASTSRRLIDDLARLLLRCGIYARIKTARKAGYRNGYHLFISGSEQQLLFCDEIGVHGARAGQAEEVARNLRTVRANTNVDTVPKEIWVRVKQALVDQQLTHREYAAAMQIQFCGSTLWRHAPSRSRLAKAAASLKDPELAACASSDVHWDSVVSVERLGEQEVYDATVLGTHNFIADGIAVHNSLEQDADMVILLSRDDAYDKESPRLGEADFIVAKHRNGPTKTIVTAFQGHYSRFVDMQH